MNCFVSDDSWWNRPLVDGGEVDADSDRMIGLIRDGEPGGSFGFTFKNNKVEK